MNKSSAFFITHDFISAAVKPFKDKFTLLSPECDDAYYLYFYINPVTEKPDYGKKYASFFRDGNPLYCGDIFDNLSNSGKTFNCGGFNVEYITLLDPVLKDIRTSASKVLNSFEPFPESEMLDSYCVFADNIDETSRNIFINYAKKFNINIITVSSFDVYAVKNHLAVNGLNCQNRKFAVVEALGSDLNMSIVDVDYPEAKRKFFKTIVDSGTDPRIAVIAKKIVDDVNRQEGLLSGRDDIQKEYVRHREKAVKIIEAIQKLNKPFLRIETSFACDKGRKTVVNLSIEEIDKLTYIYTRQLSVFFTDGFLAVNNVRMSEIEAVILSGTSVCNESATAEFERLFPGKIVKTDNKTDIVLQEVLNSVGFPVREAENSTVFLSATPPPSQIPQNNSSDGFSSAEYHKVQTVAVLSLTPGNVLKINTFDPAPNKGKAIQELEYIGNNTFKVVMSTRTLMPGDMAVAVTPVFQNGIQLEYQITRGGQNLGLFRTRPVVEILIK